MQNDNVACVSENITNDASTDETETTVTNLEDINDTIIVENRAVILSNDGEERRPPCYENTINEMPNVDIANTNLSRIPILNARATTRNLLRPCQSETMRMHSNRIERIFRYYDNLLGTIESEDNIQVSHQTHLPPPLTGAPPSYSAVMRVNSTSDELTLCRSRIPIRIQPSPPFIAPPPPPRYTHAQGYQIESPFFVTQVDEIVWGPNPMTLICPACNQLIMTSIQTHRSSLMHISAIVLCFCGCWPCCFLPYCMDSCKNTYHYCSNCQQFLGVYKPW